MFSEDTTGETIGTKALTWALILGAALLFVEATWSPLTHSGAARTPNVQTVTVQPHERVAMK